VTIVLFLRNRVHHPTTMFQSLLDTFYSSDPSSTTPEENKITDAPEKVELSEAVQNRVQQQSDAAFKSFLDDLDADPAKTGWENYVDTPDIAVWKKWDEGTGIYRLKLIARIAFPVDVVEKVMFDHTLRMTWDRVIKEIKELNSDADKSLLYISVNVPMGLSYRDFVHLRGSRVMPSKIDPSKKAKVIVDVSVDETVPERADHVRAHTILSGGLFEPIAVAENREGCLYHMVSEVDIKGDVPKSLVNLVLAKSTLDWIDSLSKACDLFVKGQLIPGEQSSGGWGSWLGW